MGIVTTLVMRSETFEQIFNLPLPGCCIWNLIEIGPAVSEKSFEKVDDPNDGSLIYTISSPEAFGSGELKMYQLIFSKFYSIFL